MVTIYYENNTEKEFDFDASDIALKVVEKALDNHGIKLRTAVNLIIVDETAIRETNREMRDIDKVTDVLSFPNLEYDTPGIIEVPEQQYYEYYDPETEDLLLGDIMICAEKIFSQAEEYGHSIKREYAFLVAHSILHLLGYDHIDDDERRNMEMKQDEMLRELGITRDLKG